MRLLALAIPFLLACRLQPAQPRPKSSVVILKMAASPFAIPPATWEECSGIDRNQVGWAAAGAASGGLGAASAGLTAAFDSNTAKYVLSATGAAFGVLATVSSFLASHYAKRYAQRCTDNTGGN